MPFYLLATQDKEKNKSTMRKKVKWVRATFANLFKFWKSKGTFEKKNIAATPDPPSLSLILALGQARV